MAIIIGEVELDTAPPAPTADDAAPAQAGPVLDVDAAALAATLAWLALRAERLQDA